MFFNISEKEVSADDSDLLKTEYLAWQHYFFLSAVHLFGAEINLTSAILNLASI